MAFKSCEQDAGMLFPAHIGDLIPEGHLARAVSEVVDKLDIRMITQTYSTVGQNAYHPRMILKLLYYGYATGTRSSRMIAKAVGEVIPFMWLAGGRQPDFRTISDFRKKHIGRIKELFVQIVRICCEMGIVKTGHWSIDGTKVKANASKSEWVTRDAVEKELKRVREEIEEALAEAERIDAAEDALLGEDDPGEALPKEIRKKKDRAKRLDEALRKLNENPDRDNVNRTDLDAVLMKRKGGGFEPSYNPQMAVDADSQVILGAGVTDEPTDNAQLIEQLDDSIMNVEAKPEGVLADAGYTGVPNLEELEKRGVEGFVPQGDNPENREKESGDDEAPAQFERVHFEYDPASDSYRCPAGETLRFSHIKKKKQKCGTKIIHVYKRVGCKDCRLASRCLKRSPNCRSLERPAREDLVVAMNERLGSELGKTVYRKRKTSVEPAFGVMKTVMRFREFLLRGLPGVRAEWLLACGAFNLRKICAFRTPGA
jgi:transposase